MKLDVCVCVCVCVCACQLVGIFTIENVVCFIVLLCLCSDYVDEVFGGKSLWPAKPHQKALARILVTDFGDKVSN